MTTSPYIFIADEEPTCRANKSFLPVLLLHITPPLGGVWKKEVNARIVIPPWCRLASKDCLTFDTLALGFRPPFSSLRVLCFCRQTQRFSTTLLFADISGFTRLSARLNAEQLKIHTNQYFTMLIDVVRIEEGGVLTAVGRGGFGL